MTATGTPVAALIDAATGGSTRMIADSLPNRAGGRPIAAPM
jgi:hypothetical protein